jgi:hypothetical protein
MTSTSVTCLSPEELATLDTFTRCSSSVGRLFRRATPSDDGYQSATAQARSVAQRAYTNQQRVRSGRSSREPDAPLSDEQLERVKTLLRDAPSLDQLLLARKILHAR